MIPCINKESLKLLVGTADERYSTSSDYFRKTHFPQIMHRYYGTELLAEVTEMELFEELLECDSVGNRVYLIFGSTGSGKSELLCWIKDKWIMQGIERPVIRISRSELNPQILIKKCFETIGIPMGVQIDEGRWELLLKKPITLINQIVWTTLAELLPTDEEIVPVALLLRPIIEKNVTEFTLQVQQGKIRKPLELLHRVQYDELLESTTLDIPLEYPLFRQSLSHKLDQFLFEGWDIGSLFKQLTEQLVKSNVRPLLLIDDLVQSVNIYATDLLDQLITLEEGNWDVVIGLTPGAVRDSDRGFDLTQRIQNLDTITDRVKKLWLSDESGKDFYNLDRRQVVPYLSNYLVQLKSTQGFTCSKACSHYQDCANIARFSSENEGKDEVESHVHLLPLNHSVVKRTFDAIPLGKGKLRYMILNSRELIRFFQKGKREHVSRVIPLVNREKFADHPDLFIKTYAEWFVSEKKPRCTIPREVFKHFGYESGDLLVNLHSLNREATVAEKEASSMQETLLHHSEVKVTVREWVEGNTINAELLEPVRMGVAALVHDMVKGVHMSRMFTPNSGSAIQRKEIINRVRYPIILDEIETDQRVIQVKRSFAALQISKFHFLKYSEKGNLLQQIANEYETARWVYQAENLHNEWEGKLENELGLTLPLFAYQFKKWVESNLLVSQSNWALIGKSRSPFSMELVNLADTCYQDWFMLRDNMFVPIEGIAEMQPDFDRWIQSFVPGKELEHYFIGEVSFYVFLTSLKEKYLAYINLLDQGMRQTIQEHLLMIPYLLDSGSEQNFQYADTIKVFGGKTFFELRDYFDFSMLEQQLDEANVIRDYKKCASTFEETTRLFEDFELRRNELRSHLLYYGEVLADGILVQSPTWHNLIKDKSRMSCLVDELTKLNRCFNSTPKRASLEILQANFDLPSITHVRTVWRSLVQYAHSLAKQQPVGTDMLQGIVVWESIDFIEINRQVTEIAHREDERRRVMQHLLQDFGQKDSIDLEDLVQRIEANSEFRPAIKRHLKALLGQGYSTLPSIQWKRLIDEMKLKFPTLFEVVEIRLVVAADK